MKERMINEVSLEGYLYEHKLATKVTGPESKNPGTTYINGSIGVATDDACTNVVTVYFNYVVPTTSKGGVNATYTALDNIINKNYKTVLDAGKDGAAKLRVSTAIGLNEFYTDRNGKEELVSSKRNVGGFIHITDKIDADEAKRNKFTCDMIITGTTRLEADEDRKLPEKVIVKGAIFDFRGSLLPVEFSATNTSAMDYFEGLEASPKNPVFTKLWGKQISETITRTITEESAFGEDSVREVKNSRRDFLVTGAARETYVWDDESTITNDELRDAIAAREIYLADIKQKAAEYAAKNKTAGTATPAIANTTKSGFQF
jgi:hypothetical protein